MDQKRADEQGVVDIRDQLRAAFAEYDRTEFEHRKSVRILQDVLDRYHWLRIEDDESE